MRSNYVTQGLSFSDKNNKPIGKSKIIGKKALIEGAISRFILPMPLALSIITVDQIHKRKLIQTNWKLKLSEFLLSGSFLYFGLPFSIAIFNQKGSFDVNLIEEYNKDLLNGIKYSDKYVYYNKGL